MQVKGWVTAESAAQARKKGKALEGWLSEVEAAQAALEPTAPLSIHSKDILTRGAQYQRAAQQLLRRRNVWAAEGDSWWASADCGVTVGLAVLVALAFFPLSTHDPRRTFLQYGADTTDFAADPLGFSDAWTADGLSLATLLRRLQHALLGPSPSATAAFNVLLHAANAVGAYRLALLAVAHAQQRKVGEAPSLSEAVVCGGCALLGALHPLLVTTVAWEAGQPVLLACGCCLLALTGHIRHRLSPSAPAPTPGEDAPPTASPLEMIRGAAGLAVAACCCSLWSSRAAGSVPALLLAYAPSPLPAACSAFPLPS